MAGRGAIKPPKIGAELPPPRSRQKVAPAPLAGGGAEGGRLALDPSLVRQAIEDGRIADRNLTVGQDLTSTLTGLDVSPTNSGGMRPAAAQLVDSLHRAVVEDMRTPGDNSLEPYRAAIRGLMDNGTGDPVEDARRIGIARHIAENLSASLAQDKTIPPGAAPQVVAKLFSAQPLNPGGDTPRVPAAAQIATLPADQQELWREGRDYADAIRRGREMFASQSPLPNDPEGVGQSPLASEFGAFDDTRQGRDLFAAMARIEQKNPALRGLLDNPEVSMAPAGLDPAAPADRGDYAYSLTGLLGDYNTAKPFFYEDRPPGIERKLYPAIAKADAVQAMAEATGKDFFPALPPQSSTSGPLDLLRTRDDGPEGAAMAPKSRAEKDESGNYTGRIFFEVPEDKASVPEGSVSTPDNDYYYRTGVGQHPAIKKALGLVESKWSRNPDFDPSNPDAVDAAGNRIPQYKPQSEHFTGVLNRLLEGEDVPQSGRVLIDYGTSGNMNASLERSIMGEGRSPQAKYRELVHKVMSGEHKAAPKALRGLVDGRPAPDAAAAGPRDPMAGMSPQDRVAASGKLQNLLDQGGILPLDEMAGYWRGIYTYIDPADGKYYMGHLSPELLSRLIAQQLLIDNPHDIARLIPVVARSMEAYDMVPPSGKALEFYNENGMPRIMQPSGEYLKTMGEELQRRGIPPKPEVRLRGMPTTNQVSSTTPRFSQDQFRASPVSTLIG